MFDNVLIFLTFVSALASGLISGIFFAFSNVVMKGLDRLPSAQGIAAMQSINITVLNPLFLSLFCGTAAASGVLIVASLFELGETEAVLRLIGGALYLAGTFLVTITLNVPRNEELAAVEPDSADGAALWEGYVPNWTAWNTVRTATALAATATLIGSLLVS